MRCPPVRFIFLGLWSTVGAAACQLHAAASAPTITPELVPAAGLQAVDIEIPALGRYSISALGGQGSVLTLVDRMSGPGATDGVIGERNGRIDTFLDAGAYRVRVLSDLQGRGDVRVQVHAFAAAPGEGGQVLEAETMLPATTLADLQQRAWWVEAPSGVAEIYEAAGRSLADLRLWRDGRWLVDARPECVPVGEHSPRPLTRCTLVGPATAGVYQLLAYGGPARPWADGLADQPLYVRRGVPSLPIATPYSGVISPFGLDRLRVDRVGWVRLTLPSAAPAALSTRPWLPTAPLNGSPTSARIAADSRVPQAELYPFNRQAQVVTVSAAPGQAYTLQALAPEGATTPLTVTGPQLVATLHSGDPRDNIDATGVILATVPTRQVVAVSAVVLDAPYRRRFNLNAQATMYVEVKQPGRWRLTSPGVNLRVEPFFAGLPEGVPPKGYMAPPFTPDATSLDLGAGLYVVTLDPRASGIAELTMSLAGTVGPVQERPPRAALLFPSITLPKGGRAALHVGTQPGVVHGVVAEALPWKATGALTVPLAAGEALDLPVIVGAPVTLAAPQVELRVEEADPAATVVLKKGEHVLHMRNPGGAPVLATLARATARDEERRGPSIERVPVPAAAASHPALTIGETPVDHAFDLAKEESRLWELHVPTAGLYRLESTGLLAMAGELRTRFDASVASGESNGDGRNFRLLPWLAPGSYLLSAQALGESAGHAGLRLQRVSAVDGGTLPAERVAGAFVEAGEGIVYQLRVETAGRYTVLVDAPGAAVPLRIDDADGWPLVGPGAVGPLTLELEAGTYRLTELPLAGPVRRETWFHREIPPVPLTGHGPHPLDLDVTQVATWIDAAAAPDVWTFTLPARIAVVVRLGADVRGELVREGAAAAVATLTEGRGYAGTLDAGPWELRVTSARGDNAVPYEVRLEPAALLPGMSRTVSSRAIIPLVIGSPGLYRLRSVGSGDVRGRLVDAAGATVAAVDDADGGWNFVLTRVLAAGAYQLELRPVGRTRGTTTVTLETVSPDVRAPIGAPGTVVVRVDPDPAVAPLHGEWVTGSHGRVWVARVRSGAEPPGQTVALALEAADSAGGWRVVAEAEGGAPLLLARTAAGGRYRLRWVTNGASAFEAAIEISAVDATELDARTMARGVSTPRRSEGGISVWAPRLEPPGTLWVAVSPGADSADAGVSGALAWSCPQPDAACGPLVTGALPPTADVAGAPTVTPWLVAADARVKVSGTRLAVKVAGPGAPPVPMEVPVPARVDLEGAGGAGWLVVRVKSTTSVPVLGRPEGAVALADVQINEGGATGALVVVSAASSVEVQGAPGRASVTVRRVTEPVPMATAGAGRMIGSLPGGTARRWSFTGTQEVTLAMEVGLVARLTRGDDEWTFAATSARRLYRFDVAGGGTLTVLNDGADARVVDLAVESGGAPLSIGAEPGPGSAQVEAPFPGVPAERRWPTRGTWLVSLDPCAATDAWAQGDVTSVTLVSPRGAVRGESGESIALPGCLGAPVRLAVDHGPGRVSVWTRSGDVVPSWVGGGAPPALVQLGGALPAAVPLTGVVARFTTEVPAPGLLRIDAPGVGVILLERGGDKPRLEVPDGTGHVVVPVGDGEWTVSLRGFGGAPLTGAASVDFRAAASVTVDGVWRGPEVWLAPRDVVPYLLHVDEAGIVALGVRAADMDIDTVLYTSLGVPVGEGRSQSHPLAAGDYLYVLRAGPDASPGMVRALVAGGADSTPPVEEIRRLAGAGGRILAHTPPAASGGWEDVGHADTGSYGPGGFGDRGNGDTGGSEEGSGEGTYEGEGE